jgi:hydrogenase maturation factor HypF (carbamoyltransferase family)
MMHSEEEKQLIEKAIADAFLLENKKLSRIVENKVNSLLKDKDINVNLNIDWNPDLVSLKVSNG